MSPESPYSPAANQPSPDRRWPRPFRRAPMEMAACVLICLGILMLLQPFALVLYTWSFVTMLTGTVLFMVVSKFPA